MDVAVEILTWCCVSQHFSETAIYFVLWREIHALEHFRSESNAVLGLARRGVCPVGTMAIGKVLVVVVAHDGWYDSVIACGMMLSVIGEIKRTRMR